jgi:hypothetical protein
MLNSIGFFQNKQDDSNKYDKEDFFNRIYSSKSPIGVWDINELESYNTLVVRKNPIFYLYNLYDVVSNIKATDFSLPVISNSILNNGINYSKSLYFSSALQSLSFLVPLNTNNITFSFWAKLSTVNDTKPIISLIKNSTVYSSISIINDELQVKISNGITSTTNNTTAADLVINTLYYISVVVTNSNIIVYKNGTQIHNFSHTQPLDFSGDFSLSVVGITNTYLEGLSIFSSALDSSYILSLSESGNFTKIKNSFNSTYDASSTTSKPKQGYIEFYNGVKLSGLNIDNDTLQGYKTGSVFSHSNALSAIVYTSRNLKTNSDNDYNLIDSTASDYFRFQIANSYVTPDGNSGKLLFGDATTYGLSTYNIPVYNTVDSIGVTQTGSSGRLKFYYNGKLVTYSNTAAAAYDSSSIAIEFGAKASYSSVGYHSCTGKLFGSSLWNRCLDEWEIADIHTSSLDIKNPLEYAIKFLEPIHYYKFDAIYDSKFLYDELDSSVSSGYNITNNEKSLDLFDDGKNSIYFNGSSSKVSIYSEQLNNIDSFSILLHILIPSNVTGDIGILSKISGLYGIDLVYNGTTNTFSNSRISYSNGYLAPNSTAIIINDGKPHQLILTFDKIGAAHLMIDGYNRYNFTYTGTSRSSISVKNDGPLLIGKSSSNWLTGYIKHIAIYNYAIGHTVPIYLYSAAFAGAYPLPIETVYKNHSTNGIITSNSNISSNGPYKVYGGHTYNYTGSNISKNYTRKTYNSTKGCSTKFYNTPGSQCVNYISTSGCQYFNLNADFVSSISFFIQLESNITTPDQSIYWYSASNGANFVSYAYITNGNILYYCGKNGTEYNTTLKLEQYVPYFITIDHLKNTIRVYVNGKLYNEIADSAGNYYTLNYPTDYRYISRFYTTGSKEDFGGVIDYFNYIGSGDVNNVVSPFNYNLYYYKSLQYETPKPNYSTYLLSVCEAQTVIPFTDKNPDNKLTNLSYIPYLPYNNTNTITKYYMENITPGEITDFYKWPSSGDPYYKSENLWAHPSLDLGPIVTTLLLHGDYNTSSSANEYILSGYTPSQSNYWDFLYKQYATLNIKPLYGWAAAGLGNVFNRFSGVPLLIQVVQDAANCKVFINGRIWYNVPVQYYTNTYNMSYMYLGRKGNSSEAWRYGISNYSISKATNDSSNIIAQQEALLSNSFRRYLLQLNPVHHYICKYAYDYLLDIIGTNNLTKNSTGTLVKIVSDIMKHNDSKLFYTDKTDTYLTVSDGMINITGSAFTLASVFYLHENSPLDGTERILFSRTGSINDTSSFKLTYYYKAWVGYVFKLYYYIGATQYTYTLDNKNTFYKSKPGFGDTVFVSLVYNESGKYFEIVVNDIVEQVFVTSGINKSTDSSVEFRVGSDKLSNTTSYGFFPSELAVYNKALSTVELNILRKEFYKNALTIKNIYHYTYDNNPMDKYCSTYGTDLVIPEEKYNNILKNILVSNSSTINITSSLNNGNEYIMFNDDNNDFITTSSVTTATFVLDYKTPIKANSIKIQTSSMVDNSPYSISIFGSNDNVNFDHLGSKNFDTWLNNEVRYFSYINEKSYRYYKIIIPWGSSTGHFALKKLILLNEKSDARYNIHLGLSASLLHSTYINTGHTVSASSEYDTSNYNSWRAFNYSGGWQCWISGNSTYNLSTGLPVSQAHWLQYQFPDPRMLSGYIIVTRGDANRGDPKQITTLGSNDGVIFETISINTFSSNYIGNGTTYKKAILNNVKYYKYYRFVVDSTYVAGSGVYASIGELYLLNSTMEKIGAIQAHKIGSYTSPTGTAFCSTDYWSNEYLAYNAFHYSSNLGKALVTEAGYPHTVAYTFTEPKIIIKYAYAIRLDATYSGRPAAWTFQASNDGSSWTTLDTKSGQADSGTNSYREYTISNTTAYRYYKMVVTSSYGQGYTSFAHFKLYE